MGEEIERALAELYLVKPALPRDQRRVRVAIELLTKLLGKHE